MPETLLVTGGAGFIGSHLVRALLAQGADVVILDDLSSGKRERVPREAQLATTDLANGAAVAQLLDETRPAAIYHLGAQSSVTVSLKDPARDLAVNVLGTLNILEAASRHRAPVVMTSTGGALYGNQAPTPTAESHPPAPISPYGASKWAGEAYLRTWAEASGLPHSICRLANVYGPGQSSDGEAGIVAILSNQLRRRLRPTLYGYGQPTRDYIHVNDVVRALVAARGAGETINVATGRALTVSEVFQILRKEAGVEIKPELAPLRQGELEHSCLNPSRARLMLGWEAEIDAEVGMPETYRSFCER